MAFLEKQHILHRDLRAANVLVGDNLEVQVSGFERAIERTEGDLQTPYKANPLDEQYTFQVRCDTIQED